MFYGLNNVERVSFLGLEKTCLGVSFSIKIRGWQHKMNWIPSYFNMMQLNHRRMNFTKSQSRPLFFMVRFYCSPLKTIPTVYHWKQSNAVQQCSAVVQPITTFQWFNQMKSFCCWVQIKSNQINHFLTPWQIKSGLFQIKLQLLSRFEMIWIFIMIWIFSNQITDISKMVCLRCKQNLFWICHAWAWFAGGEKRPSIISYFLDTVERLGPMA